MRWLPIVLTCAWLCPSLSVADEVDAAVAAIQAQHSTPLIDLAVTTRQGICVARRYGDPSANSRRLHAASISKLFTATAIMQLVEQGRLSLTDPVGKYVPEFAASTITVEQLLTHTSGLKDRQRADGRRQPDEVDKYFAALARQRPERKQQAWSYSDAGFNLLGRVIATIYAKSFEDVMRERFLSRLHMDYSDFDLSRLPAANRATAYNGRRSLTHPWDLAFIASSGMQTKASDLGKFAQAVLSIYAGEADATAVLVSRSSLLTMTTARVDTEWSGIRQGYGWQLSATPLGPQWRHAGGEAGFESLLTIYPERGFGIVVMGNSKDWPRFELERQLRQLTVAGAIRCSTP